MRCSVRLRTAPATPHPPYGLFVDPHRGRHTWWEVDPRAILALVTVLASLGTVLGVITS